MLRGIGGARLAAGQGDQFAIGICCASRKGRQGKVGVIADDRRAGRLPEHDKHADQKSKAESQKNTHAENRCKARIVKPVLL